MGKLKGFFIDSVELPDPDFTGASDNHFAFYSLISFGLFILLRDIDALVTTPVHETIVNLIFELLLFIPVILINVKSVEIFTEKSMKKNNGILVVTVPIAISALYYGIASIGGFQTIVENLGKLEGLFVPGTPWLLNLLVAYGFMFVIFRFSVLLMNQRAEKHFLAKFFKGWRGYKETWAFFIILLATSPLIANMFHIGMYACLAPVLVLVIFLLSQVPALKYSTGGITFSDFFALLPMGLIVLVFQDVKFVQPQVPLALILVALFHAGGESRLGRAHFHYKYTPRSKDLTDLVNFTLLSFAIILPISILIHFIDLSNFRLLDVTVVEIFKNVNVWTYYVGISEEIIFRVLLLVILSDLLALLAKKKESKGKEPGALLKYPKFWALILSSAIFGVSHASKGWNYALLAFIAGYAYGFLFLKNRNLFGPIFLHMTIDVVAVTFFGASL